MSVKSQLNYDPWAVIEGGQKNTPDWSYLKEQNHTQDEFMIFVTGNLRKNRRDNLNFLSGANFYGQGETYDSDYMMKRGPFETATYTPEPLVFSFPAKDEALRNEWSYLFNFALLGKVEGDIYGVDLRTITMIDEHQGNNDGTDRMEKWFKFHHPKQQQRPVKCFMWLMNMKHFEDFAAWQHDKLMLANSSHNGMNRSYYFSS